LFREAGIIEDEKPEDRGLLGLRVILLHEAIAVGLRALKSRPNQERWPEFMRQPSGSEGSRR
jgi:hypothetical protein